MLSMVLGKMGRSKITQRMEVIVRMCFSIRYEGVRVMDERAYAVKE